ncbi:MAG: hypothetical protein K8H86_08475 [Ignavibacteriaceae bacterium]|nr:hypothetical protein [Ignavibacteriaceae bacterium]
MFRIFKISNEYNMIKHLFIICSSLFLIFISTGCSSSVDNSIKFKNFASGDIYINFRGELISVASGKTVEIKDVTKGTYNYSTTYEVPANTQSSSVQGDVSGNIIIKAGTKILIVYSSTFVDGTYTIYATISSSDDQTNTTGVVTP